MKLKFKHVFLLGLWKAAAIVQRGGKAEPRRCKHEFGAMPRMLKPEPANRWRYGQEAMRQIAAHERLERLAENNALANWQQEQRREERKARLRPRRTGRQSMLTLIAMTAAINS